MPVAEDILNALVSHTEGILHCGSSIYAIHKRQIILCPKESL